MRFKTIIFSILIILLISVHSEVGYANANHWFYPTEQEMLNLKLIDTSERFYEGNGFTEQDMTRILKRIFPGRDFVPEATVNNPLTRAETISLLFKHLNLEKIISKMPEPISSFTDVDMNTASINLALQFDFISMNQQSTFRPNVLIKKEEAYSILYNVYKSYISKFDLLHSYYAINSYPQLEYVDHLSTLSFGWSRLELSADRTQVILNMSRLNSNEYRVPSGYETVANATDRDSLSRQLMVFVREEFVYDATLKKNVSLAEAILSNQTWRDSVIDAVLNAIVKDDYQMNFDGVLIDFEGLKGESNASHLNVFLQLLSEKLRNHDLKLYVAVHPIGINKSDYYDGYDYKTIGQYADYVVLMAHDYYAKRLSPVEMALGYTVTPLTPINEVFYALANISHPETGVQDLSKILLQFSMDTAQWKLKEDKVIHSIPYHPLYSSIETRIKEGAMRNYSANLQSPYLTFTDESDGTYNIIWYENVQSIEAKIELAKLFKIGGLSIWRLGTIPNYDTQDLNIWSTILKHMN